MSEWINGLVDLWLYGLLEEMSSKYYYIITYNNNKIFKTIDSEKCHENVYWPTKHWIVHTNFNSKNIFLKRNVFCQIFQATLQYWGNGIHRHLNESSNTH